MNTIDDWKEDVARQQAEQKILEGLAMARFQQEKGVQEVVIALDNLDPWALSQEQRRRVLAACHDFIHGAWSVRAVA